MITINDLRIIIDIARRAPMLPAEANWLELQAQSIDTTLEMQARAAQKQKAEKEEAEKLEAAKQEAQKSEGSNEQEIKEEIKAPPA